MTGILCSLPMIGAPTAATSGGGGGGSVSNPDAAGTGSTDTIITNTVTATGGGSTTRGYSWERISGDSAITASRASSASTSFQRNNCQPGTSYSAVFRCRITSGAGFTYSPNVSVLITRTA